MLQVSERQDLGAGSLPAPSLDVLAGHSKFHQSWSKQAGWSWLSIPAEDGRCWQVDEVGGQERVIHRGTEVPGLCVLPAIPSRAAF